MEPDELLLVLHVGLYKEADRFFEFSVLGLAPLVRALVPGALLPGRVLSRLGPAVQLARPPLLRVLFEVLDHFLSATYLRLEAFDPGEDPSHHRV